MPDKPDETGLNGQAAEPAQGAGLQSSTLPKVDDDSSEPFDQARAMETIRKLRDFEKQAKRDLKDLAALRDAKAAADAAAMTETQKLQKQLADAQAELARVRKIQIGLEAGLPPELASRIVGESEEELKADADRLLALIPKPAADEGKPAKPAKPVIKATNPGSEASAAESLAQRRNRLLGTNAGAFSDPNLALQQGGGVVFVEAENKSEKQEKQ